MGYELLQKNEEVNFIQHLCSKRVKNFDSQTIKEQNRVKSKIINELLDRDKSELALFESNSENIRGQNQQFIKMMQKRLSAGADLLHAVFLDIDIGRRLWNLTAERIIVSRFFPDVRTGKHCGGIYGLLSFFSGRF